MVSNFRTSQLEVTILTFESPRHAINFLREWRKALGWTQRDIADKGFNGKQSNVGAVEAETDRAVTFEKLQKYAKVLGYKVVIGLEIDDEECP